MKYDGYEAIQVGREGRILRLTLNRPEALNAVDGQLHRELAHIFYDVAADREADVVILTGAGKAFCAGGDLDWIESMVGDPDAFLPTMWEAKRIVYGLLELDKPVVARVPGPAIGLGATLALFCDITFAAESAVIADPHVNVGLVAGDGGAVIWPQLIGYARAKEYLLTGQTIGAKEAERIGLINHAVADAELDDAVSAMADRLAAGATRAIRWTKVAVNLGLKQIANAAFEGSVAWEAVSQASEVHRLGLEAFRKRERPRFVGR